jgi:transcriptional regulator with AAA-type ATPase domain
VPSNSWPGNVRELQNVIIRYCATKRIDLTSYISLHESIAPVSNHPSLSFNPSKEGGAIISLCDSWFLQAEYVNVQAEIEEIWEFSEAGHILY